MYKYLFIAIIIIVICIIYWKFIYNSDNSRRERALAYLRKSPGTFDINAQLALTELTKIRDPRLDDFFLRGYIPYTHHLLNQDIYILDSYRKDVLNNLLRDFAVAAREHLIDDRSIRLLLIDPNFMIDRIEDFRRMENIHARTFREHDERLTGELDALEPFTEQILINVPKFRKKLADDKLKEAQATTKTRVDAINKYFDSSIHYTNDRQNVHDSKVNNSLRNIFAKLKASAGDSIHANTGRIFDEATQYISGEYTAYNKDKAVSALAVLHQLRSGRFIETFKSSEENIFACVWTRCNHPQNAHNKKLMYEAVANALADSIENNTMVCINGRCSRLLNSLALLDFDKDISESNVLTYEAYKNQIYQETKDIINREIELAKNSADATLVEVGTAYETGEALGTSAEELFKTHIQTAIDKNIDSYADKLSIDERQKIKADCYMYAFI